MRSVVVTAACVLAVAGCDNSETGSAVGGYGGQQAPSVPPSAGSPSSPASVDSPEDIPGIKHIEYPPGLHVVAPDRVDYQESPPFGGRHDQVWAACNGVVYPEGVRTENMVHSLEHGAVWIAYDPDKVDQAGVSALAARVQGKPYTMMSPYPGLDQPISLQSWGYQLKLGSAADPRIDRFISGLHNNRKYTPEFGAPCDPLASELFDQDNPPPFDPSPPGPDAMPGNG